MAMTEDERREAGRAASRRHYARNREAYRARERTPERRAAKREDARRNPDRTRNNFLRSRYGITLDDYQAMAEAQGHACKLCGKTREQEGRDLAVDHCHETGKVRGLLCTNCNTSLAVIENDRVKFQRMLDYIEEHKP